MIKVTTQANSISVDYENAAEMELLVLRGLPGSGKSRIAEVLSSGDMAVVCSADDYFRTATGYQYDYTKLTHVHHLCFKKFLEHVGWKTSLIVIDNTNIYGSDYAPYILYGQTHGYECRVLTVWCTLEEAMQRQEHTVPLKLLTKQYNNLLAESFPPWIPHETILNG